jgi:DDE superfamily endonuclease/helix-turn-helix, Psq domain
MADISVNMSKAERVEAAVRDCRQENGLTARKAAKIYRIAPSTITRRLKQLTSSRGSHSQRQQLLTPVEERTIIKWAIQYYKWGLPLGLKHLRQFATEILLRKQPQQRRQSSPPSLGLNWHKKLLFRNPEIKRVVARGLDRSRASTMLKKEIFEEYFELYNSLRQKYNILDQDLYNMDEKGFLMGAIQRSHVVIPVHEREAFLRQDGSREWISVVETISANGEYLPSWIIFKAVYQQNSWFDCLDTQNSRIATSQKGWTDNQLGLEWLRRHFDVETAKRQLGEYRMLILDGHESHCTLEFIEYCSDHKIILLVLPPHTTHLLQPLDVAIFQPLAKYYSLEVEEHMRWLHHWLEKEDFIKYYQEARKKALREANIFSAWKKTGIIPYNPQEVLTKLPNRPTTPPESTQLQLIVNGSSPLNLLIGADHNYVAKATQAIRDTMLGSPADHVVNTIEYLNANNAVLSKVNAELVAATRARKEAKKSRKSINKARVLSKTDADELRAEQEARDIAARAHQQSIQQKKHEQTLKKAQIEAEKAERALQRARAKETREINAEMGRMARINPRLFT